MLVTILDTDDANRIDVLSIQSNLDNWIQGGDVN